MAPTPSRNRDSRRPVRSIWLPILTFGAVAIATVQVFLHTHHPQSAAISNSGAAAVLGRGTVETQPSVGSESTTTYSQQLEATNAKLITVLESTRLELKASEGRERDLDERLRKASTTAAPSRRQSPPLPPPPLPPPPPPLVLLGGAAEAFGSEYGSGSGLANGSRPLLMDEGYDLRGADCDLLLSQRRRVASMDEEYAFVKYDRGKVPFNTEWSPCDVKKSSVVALHCFDSWILRHCRGVLLEHAAASLGGHGPVAGPAGGGGGSGTSGGGGGGGGAWAAWLQEAAAVYPALTAALGAPPPDRGTSVISQPPGAQAAAALQGGGSGHGSSGHGGSGHGGVGRFYFIAACLHNNAPLLKGGWAEQLELLAKHLAAQGDVGDQGPVKVVVSIYENDSGDGTPAFLAKLRDALDAAEIENYIVGRTCWPFFSSSSSSPES